MHFKNHEEVVSYLRKFEHDALLALIRQEVNRAMEESKTSNSTLILTSDEVCRKYKISKSTLKRHIDDGLRVQTKGYRCKKTFKESDILFFLEKNNNAR